MKKVVRIVEVLAAPAVAGMAADIAAGPGEGDRGDDRGLHRHPRRHIGALADPAIARAEVARRNFFITGSQAKVAENPSIAAAGARSVPFGRHYQGFNPSGRLLFGQRRLPPGGGGWADAGPQRRSWDARRWS